MADIYRKTSLEKLSSPEQLDKMIVITPPSFWLAIVGAGLIIAVALTWAILGRLPDDVDTQGIYVNRDGTYSVYSETSGVVNNVLVKAGDEISKGDVIASLTTDDIEQQIENYSSRIEKVENITMDSESDAVTADNKTLVEIKNQMLTIDQSLYENQELLNFYSSELATQRKTTAAAEQAMLEAEVAYYNSLNTGNSTAEQIAYSDAQTKLATATSNLEAAYSYLDSATISYNQAKSSYDNSSNSYDKVVAQANALKETADNKWDELVSAYNKAVKTYKEKIASSTSTISTTTTTNLNEAAPASVNETDDDSTSVQSDENSNNSESSSENGTETGTEETETSQDTSAISLTSAYLYGDATDVIDFPTLTTDNYSTYVSMLAEALGDSDLTVKMNAYATAYSAYYSYTSSYPSDSYASSKNEYEAELAAAEATKSNYEKDVKDYTNQKAIATNEYEYAKAVYLNKLNELGIEQNLQTQLSNKYSQALSDYNTEDSKLTSLEDSIAQTQISVDSAERTMEQQISSIYSQFEATKSSIIDSLNQERKQYEEQLDKCEVVSTVSGKVSSVSVVQGSAVNQGSELIKVAQGDEEDDVVVCYVSLSSGKKITEGMKVLVYPTTVSKEEYGHMTATVIQVDSYVTSTEDLRTQLGNDSLVESFMSNGPVVAVVCELQEDSSTASGYYWSSKKGKDVLLAEGTMVEASVVIEEKAPITMLIPYIKEKLTIKAQASTQ